MNLNYFKIRYIQFLLNLKINIKYYNFIFLFFLFFISATIFGFWNLLAGYFHLLALVLLLGCIFVILKISKRNFKFVSYKYAINWLEEKNFKNMNPIIALQDRPAQFNHNKLLWKAHIEQSKSYFSSINFLLPKIYFDRADPLKVRLIFLLFFFISLYWGYSNNSVAKNFSKIFQISFNETSLAKKGFNMLAWVDPPYYTGLSQINIEIKKLKDQTISVPIFSELSLQTTGLEARNIKVKIDDRQVYNKESIGSNLDIKHKVTKMENFKLLVSGKIIGSFNLDPIKDIPPKVNFISKPETVNGVSVKFSTSSKDDYKIKKASVSFSRPLEYEHFEEKLLLYELPITNNRNLNEEVRSFFYENLSNHLWAGNTTTIRVTVHDDLKQEGVVETAFNLPEKDFISKSANSVYKIRSNLAKRKISLDKAKENIDKVFNEKKDLLNDSLIKKKYELVVFDLSKLKSFPLSYKAPLYKNLWDLAISIEEGALVSAKSNLEQIEQNLFDSINQRETEKISTNVERYKESIESLIDLNNEEGENPMVNNETNKNIKNQIEKTTNALKDLLKTGDIESLQQKIQELKQLSESIKNPNRLDKNELLKEQKKKDFINKLSELLNEQEMIMEESFNEAANRGKFKQSSEGSGGRTSKEKQENLRNTLGNIMRDIGETENEIPQELGRADRAMRQATRELENGRPDQASNAQGRAAEMLQRAMNKMRYNNDLAQNMSENDREDWQNKNEKSNGDPIDAPEYQGTSSGGRIEIPEKNKIQEAQKIARELYDRYNEKERSAKDKRYIKNLLDWY